MRESRLLGLRSALVIGLACSLTGPIASTLGLAGDSTASSLSLSVKLTTWFDLPLAPACSQLGISLSVSEAGPTGCRAAIKMPPRGRCARGSSSSLLVSPIAAKVEL